MEKRDIVIRQFQDEIGLKARQRKQTFDAFEVREGHEAAYSAAQELAMHCAYSGAATGLLLVGPVGCGKTHLAAAIVNHVLQNWKMSRARLDDAGECVRLAGYGDNPPRIKFVSVVSLLESIRAAYNNGGHETVQDIIGGYARAGILILDDLGTEKMTEWAGERIFEIIDYRYCEELPTVITTNLTPSTLKRVVGDRIYDRIREMCSLTTITAPSQRPTAGQTPGPGGRVIQK